MAQPEKKFKVGACTASVFVNEVQTSDGPTTMKSVSLQRAYQDKKTGDFKHTTSFKKDDIPKAILAVNKAYEYLALEAE